MTKTFKIAKEATEKAKATDMLTNVHKHEKTHRQLIEEIVIRTKDIIGVIAITQANRVPGLGVSMDGVIIKLNKPEKEIIINLAERYRYLVGPVALVIVQNAAENVFQQNKTPDILTALKKEMTK